MRARDAIAWLILAAMLVIVLFGTLWLATFSSGTV